MPIQVHNVNNPIDAEIAKNLLADYDIYSEIRDAGIIGANPLFGAAISGVKIMVNDEDADRAKEIIDQYLKDTLEQNIKTEDIFSEEKYPKDSLIKSKKIDLRIILTIHVVVLAILLYWSVDTSIYASRISFGYYYLLPLALTILLLNQLRIIFKLKNKITSQKNGQE